MTPETVYSPTLAGRRSKPRNLILCLARAGFEPTTSSTAGKCHTTVPTRQVQLYQPTFCQYHRVKSDQTVEVITYTCIASGEPYDPFNTSQAELVDTVALLHVTNGVVLSELLSQITDLFSQR